MEKVCSSEVRKYVVVHQKLVGNEAKECVIVRSLDPFSWQALDDMVASEMRDVGIRRFLPGQEEHRSGGSVLQKSVP